MLVGGAGGPQLPGVASFAEDYGVARGTIARVLKILESGGLMLANLLPGIRDLRTPLAVGYIWLLTFWLWIPAHFKDTAPTVGVTGDLARLAHYSGRVGVAIALSFIAYLIGALSLALFNAPLTRIGSFISWYGRFPRAEIPVPRLGELSFLYLWFGSWRNADSYSDAGAEMRFALANARYRVAGIDNLEGAAMQQAEQNESIRSDATGEYVAYLIREVYKQGNALLGREADLFAAYDRLIAEYEFRVGVTAPLIALIVTLAIQWTSLWLLALLPVLLLLKTGSERRMEAGDILADAYRQGRLPISLPSYLTASTAKGGSAGSGDDSAPSPGGAAQT
jgi:hypothetical protein